MEVFQDDDAGYRTWLYANMGNGYVVNELHVWSLPPTGSPVMGSAPG